MNNNTTSASLTARYYTLGCKLNFSETSTYRRGLMDHGIEDAAEGTPAGICIINTCSVTGEADHKCRQIIHRMVRENPGAFIVVTGCYAQLEAKDIAKIPGVSLVIGAEDKPKLVDKVLELMKELKTGEVDDNYNKDLVDEELPSLKVKGFAPSCSRGNRTRYWLKVQDGCSYFCTYCTIPFARGLSRNPSIASLVAQAEKAAAEGGKEIVITGVNIGDFGHTTNETFIDLVRALDGVEGIKRYRISSLEPDLISDELIEYCATAVRSCRISTYRCRVAPTRC